MAWIVFILQAVEVTVRQTINQIAHVQLLFDQTVEQVRSQASKVYSIELGQVLFDYPYSKTDYLVDRLQIDRCTASK